MDRRRVSIWTGVKRGVERAAAVPDSRLSGIVFSHPRRFVCIPTQGSWQPVWLQDRENDVLMSFRVDQGG
ncbi:hypothetical protein NPIL_498461 [Nephila pilipes]|uniref:Uncharacterized protein n=1 Tax=Nephila pilipes TaxID=299642 RepID=A0A8X6ME72_NEPPI|nr:hypothetical protein NPIL_498461 [Nephila pilipes]